MELIISLAIVFVAGYAIGSLHARWRLEDKWEEVIRAASPIGKP